MRKLTILIAACFAILVQPALADTTGVVNEIARIKNVTPGGITIMRTGQRYRATSGTRLQEGDIVETAAGQRVGITFLDNTRMAIAPNSRVIISKYRYDRARSTGAALMTVDRGKVGVDSGNLSKNGSLEFETPTSTLGVRGTTFVIEVGN